MDPFKSFAEFKKYADQNDIEKNFEIHNNIDRISFPDRYEYLNEKIEKYKSSHPMRPNRLLIFHSNFDTSIAYENFTSVATIGQAWYIFATHYLLQTNEMNYRIKPLKLFSGELRLENPDIQFKMLKNGSFSDVCYFINGNQYHIKIEYKSEFFGIIKQILFTEDNGIVIGTVKNSKSSLYDYLLEFQKNTSLNIVLFSFLALYIRMIDVRQKQTEIQFQIE